MPKFGQSSSGRRHLSAADGLLYDPFTGIYSVAPIRPPQLQNDNDLRLPTSPLEKPRLGIEARRQLRAELFGPTPEPVSQRESIYTPTSPAAVTGRPGHTLVRTNTLIPSKSTTPIDIHAAFAILKELKKTATTEELVALHRALLPEITPLQPQPESIVHYVEAVPPQNAEMRIRRSLFKPGEATRSEIEEAAKPGAGSEQSPLLKSRKSYPTGEYHPLTPPRTFTSRTATPSDLGRSYLGNYKLGSLHVTNGAASPAPVLRLKHIRNLSNTTSEKEDDYYTASEGSIKREDVFDVRHDDGVVTDIVTYEPSIDLYEDSMPADELARPKLNRRSTNDTIASTGSKYSCDSEDTMKLLPDENTIGHQQTYNLAMGQPAVLQPRNERIISSSEWVEDVDPQFLECNIEEERATSAEQRSALSEATPSHNFRPRQAALVVRQKSLVHHEPAQILQITNEKQRAQRDSAYGAEVLLRGSSQNRPIDEQSAAGIGALQNQPNQSPSCAPSPHELRKTNNLTERPILITPQKTTEIITLTALPQHSTNHAVVTPQTTLRTNLASNGVHIQSSNLKSPAMVDNVIEQKRSPRKLQKRQPNSQRALSNPIIVQRQRSIYECPYLPEDTMAKLSQRLDKSPGMDHLERTYKSVTHSESRESLMSVEPFQCVELRFPSPTPESEVFSRGRRMQRSSCGPFHSASRFFRSRSRKDAIVEEETTDDVQCETTPVKVTEPSTISSAIPRSHELAAVVWGKRRIPSGPRAMMPSGQYASRPLNDQPVPETREKTAPQFPLSRTRDFQLNQAGKHSTTKLATPEKAGDITKIKDEAEQQTGDHTGGPPARQIKRYSMLDRPRGSYYGDWLQPTPPSRKTQGERNNISPSPRSRRQVPDWEDVQCLQSENGTGERGNSGENVIQLPTTEFSPSPSRAPPPPPETSFLTLPKLRPTIRAVESTSEGSTDDVHSRTLCNPVRVSVSILKTPMLPSPLPPNRAPPLPPTRNIPLVNSQTTNYELSKEHDRKATGKYGRSLSVGLEDRRWKDDLEEVDVYNW